MAPITRREAQVVQFALSHLLANCDDETLWFFRDGAKPDEAELEALIVRWKKGLAVPAGITQEVYVPFGEVGQLVWLSRAVREAIANLVEYNFNDEERDYFSGLEEYEGSHVFEQLAAVQSWLEPGSYDLEAEKSKARLGGEWIDRLSDLSHESILALLQGAGVPTISPDPGGQMRSILETCLKQRRVTVAQVQAALDRQEESDGTDHEQE